MRNEAPVHVPPIILWQCLCGGPELTQRAFQHMLDCAECETLAKEITDALNDIESAFGSPRNSLS
jgi:hypothetical protein